MVAPTIRQECLEQYSKLPVSDNINEGYIFPKTLNSYVFTSGFKGDVEKLCFDVSDLVQRMGLDSLAFLGETETPWLAQESETKQVQDAFRYFKSQKIDETYNGGFIVDNTELPEFLKHLFSLTTFNAAFPIVYFTDKNQGMIGNLCRYGNLHIFTIGDDVDNVILDVVGQSNFKLAEGMHC